MTIKDVRISDQEIKDLATGARELVPVVNQLGGLKNNPKIAAWLLLIVILCQRANES